MPEIKNGFERSHNLLFVRYFYKREKIEKCECCINQYNVIKYTTDVR